MAVEKFPRFNPAADTSPPTYTACHLLFPLHIMGWVRKYKDILLNHETEWLDADGENRTKVCKAVALEIREFRQEKQIPDKEPNGLEEVSNQYYYMLTVCSHNLVEIFHLV